MGENREILQAIANLQLEIRKDIRELQDDINKKQEELTKNIDEIRRKQDINSRKIKELERESKKRNIIIHGLDENEKGYSELKQKVVELINSKLKVECKEEELDFVKRLGKKHENAKNRPILVGLTTWSKKIKILKNKSVLATTKTYITEDFPKEVIETRKKLQPILMEKRKEGLHAIIKYDKLIIDGEEYSKKRNRSEETSPASQNSNTKATKIQNKETVSKPKNEDVNKSNFIERTRSGSTGSQSNIKS